MTGFLRRAWGLVGFGRLRTLSIVTLSHGFVAIAFFLQMALLARLLPVDEFGHLATMLAVATVIEAAAGARGTETALAALARIPANEVAARDAMTRGLLRADLLWSLLVYALVVLGVLAYQATFGARYEWLLILMAGSFIAYPWGTIKSYLTLFMGPRAFPLVEMSYASVTLFAGVALAHLLGGLGFVIAMVAASAVRTLLGLRQAGLPLAALGGGSGPGSGLSRETLVKLGASGTVRSALLNLGGQMDILLLAAASMPAAVGLYRAAKTLSALVQRATIPVWFVLKRHIIVGSRDEGDNAHSRRMVVLASAAFLAATAIIVPALVYFGSDIVALAFGERYRGASAALVWLVSGAWLLHAVTGWSNLFGSVANERMTVIGIYLVQIALFALVAFVGGVTLGSVAFALALSQAVVAAGFWVLFFRRWRRGGPPDRPIPAAEAGG